MTRCTIVYCKQLLGASKYTTVFTGLQEHLVKAIGMDIVLHACEASKKYLDQVERCEMRSRQVLFRSKTHLAPIERRQKICHRRQGYHAADLPGLLSRFSVGARIFITDYEGGKELRSSPSIMES